MLVKVIIHQRNPILFAFSVVSTILVENTLLQKFSIDISLRTFSCSCHQMHSECHVLLVKMMWFCHLSDFLWQEQCLFFLMWPGVVTAFSDTTAVYTKGIKSGFLDITSHRFFFSPDLLVNTSLLIFSTAETCNLIRTTISFSFSYN